MKKVGKMRRPKPPAPARGSQWIVVSFKGKIAQNRGPSATTRPAPHAAREDTTLPQFTITETYTRITRLTGLPLRTQSSNSNAAGEFRAVGVVTSTTHPG